VSAVPFLVLGRSYFTVLVEVDLGIQSATTHGHQTERPSLLSTKTAFHRIVEHGGDKRTDAETLGLSQFFDGLKDMVIQGYCRLHSSFHNASQHLMQWSDDQYGFQALSELIMKIRVRGIPNSELRIPNSS
jgi:hypothetical protein